MITRDDFIKMFAFLLWKEVERGIFNSFNCDELNDDIIKILKDIDFNELEHNPPMIIKNVFNRENDNSSSQVETIKSILFLTIQQGYEQDHWLSRAISNWNSYNDQEGINNYNVINCMQRFIIAASNNCEENDRRLTRFDLLDFES